MSYKQIGMVIESESLILFIDKFCKVIEMFYNEIISCISLNPGMTPRIKVSRGIRHPVSPKLFILCTQLLACLIVNHPEFKGIAIFDYEFRISQFADNTVFFFLKDISK